jgi:hypothetical protein
MVSAVHMLLTIIAQCSHAPKHIWGCEHFWLFHTKLASRGGKSGDFRAYTSILQAEAEHLHIVLILLALMLILDSHPVVFSFKAFSSGLQIDSMLLYFQFCLVLIMFRHLMSVLICSDGGKNHRFSLVIVLKDI